MVKAELGPVTETDVDFAKDLGASIIGFNVLVAGSNPRLAALARERLRWSACVQGLARERLVCMGSLRSLLRAVAAFML